MRWLTESHVFTSCSAAFGAFDESVMFQNEFHNMSTLKRNFKGVFQVRVSVRHVLCSLLGVVFVGPVLPLSARRHCIQLPLLPFLLPPFLLRWCWCSALPLLLLSSWCCCCCCTFTERVSGAGLRVV